MERKNTAEQYYGYCWKLLLVLCLVTVLLCFLPLAFMMLGDEDFTSSEIVPMVISFGALALIFIVPAVYYLIQYLYYRKVELTDVQEVFLAKTSTSQFRQIGFEVEVTEGGVTRTVTTKRVFSADRMGPTKLDDYSGRMATVGYNAGRDEYIVIE